VTADSITVRPARAQDLETLVAFNAAMAKESEDKGLNTEILSAGISYLLEHPAEGYYLLAEIDGNPVGTAMVTYEWSDWRNGRFWWIQSVYVHSDFRRRGVYARLHDTVRTSAAQDSQCCGIRLYVEKDNSGAQATYLSLGMEQTHYLLFEEEF
jgi:ribosomal protein S18 acetylase RimI-like enzyme